MFPRIPKSQFLPGKSLTILSNCRLTFIIRVVDILFPVLLFFNVTENMQKLKNVLVCTWSQWPLYDPRFQAVSGRPKRSSYNRLRALKNRYTQKAAEIARKLACAKNKTVSTKNKTVDTKKKTPFLQNTVQFQPITARKFQRKLSNESDHGIQGGNVTSYQRFTAQLAEHRTRIAGSWVRFSPKALELHFLQLISVESSTLVKILIVDSFTNYRVEMPISFLIHQ